MNKIKEKMTVPKLPVSGSGTPLLNFVILVACVGTQCTADEPVEKSAARPSDNTAVEVQWTRLFNGRNLDNWDLVIGQQGPLRLNEDPDRIFQVHDGIVHTYKDAEDGSEVQFGYCLTKKSYSHFHLRFEFKWGTKKFKPLLDRPRDAGVLYHVVGGKVVWPRSLEFQVEEQGVGDFLAVLGAQAKSTVDPESIDKSGKGNARFREPTEGGVPFVSGGPGVYRIYRHLDAEQEGWNTAELIVHGAESAIHKVNGKVVNRVTDLRELNADGKTWIPLKEGKILFQAEAAEAFYRNIEIRELPVAGPEPDSQPMSPDDSRAATYVREGYKIELVAAEPLVIDPVAIAWGADGRLWVAEMADYPLGMDGSGKPGGRIRILEDTDDDGKFDRSTLFLDNVAFPNGVMPWRDGVLVTAAPEIFYAEDTDGDGRADKREVVFDRFQEGNQQLRVNGLRWGLDNWVYCASGAHHGGYGADREIRALKTGATVELGSRDFRFRPDTGEIDPQSGPSQFGRNRDDWGNWFGEQNSYPLWHFVLQDHYLRRNPHFIPPDPRKHVVGPANPRVYPAKTPQKRFHSLEQSGRFTSACSAMIYRDELLFGQATIQHAFTCEPFHNLVQHNLIERDGVSFSSRRDPAETDIDFFASRDRWCRPVQVRTGPDGALWVVDMYRYMIEHPEWLTPEGREELRPFYRSGDDRGRIYRIVPKAEHARPANNLADRTTEGLVAALDSPNGTQRDLAQQMLLWRAGKAAVEPLEAMTKTSPNPLARLHALCTLDGLGSLSPALVTHALGDEHAGVRRQAIRLSEPLAERYPDLITAAVKLVDDPDAAIRLQLACTLGEWTGRESAEALAKLAIRDAANVYLAAAVSSSVNKQNVGELLTATIAGLRRVDQSDASVASIDSEASGESRSARSNAVVGRLLMLAVAFGNYEATRDGLEAILQTNARDIDAPAKLPWQFETVAGLFDALERSQQSLDVLALGQDDRDQAVLQQIKQLIGQARTIAFDAEAVAESRVAAIRLLARNPETLVDDITKLAQLLTPQTPPDIQVAVVRHLATRSSGDIATLVLSGWPSHGPSLRGEILSMLVSRDAWLTKLLDDVEAGLVARADIDAATRLTLSVHPDTSIRTRVARLLGDSGNADRQAVIRGFQPALALTGNLSRGATVFKKTCAACHKLDGVGHEIGPNLRSITDRKPASLLTSILDPSAGVDGKYVTYIALTDDGRTFTGMMASETSNSITLVTQENKRQEILRSQLDEIVSTGKSLMPDGLEKDLSHQDVADLIAYIRRPAASSKDSEESTP